MLLLVVLLAHVLRPCHPLRGAPWPLPLAPSAHDVDRRNGKRVGAAHVLGRGLLFKTVSCKLRITRLAFPPQGWCIAWQRHSTV